MKTPTAIIVLSAVLFFSAHVQLATPSAKPIIEYAGDSMVKVAVYVESSIDSDERSNVVDALRVVENRFENQTGYKLDFEIVGNWESRKDTDNPFVLLEDAISKTNGIITTVWDNSNCGGTMWRFKRDGYVSGLYIIDQDLEGDRTGGVAVLNYRTAILDYHWDGWWHQFDWLCTGIQHEVSHLFGLKHCNEQWCAQNYAYLPYATYLNLIVVQIKLSEEWATQWGQSCKQTLIKTYNGAILKCSQTSVIWSDGSTIVYQTATWTEEYHKWNLTQLRLKQTFTVGVPRYVPSGTAHPTVIGYLRMIEP